MKNMFRYSLLSFLCVTATALWSSRAQTGPNDSNNSHGKGHHSVGLVKEVVDATRRFRDVAVATGELYEPFLGCVSGPEEGAMGIHYVNGNLVADGQLDAAQPEILVYEPQKNGKLRLVAVEYIVIADAWHAANQNPPVLSGQVFHYSGSPNRYGLPPFYSLHAWAWKQNPHGMFVDWNPKVTCENYEPET